MISLGSPADALLKERIDAVFKRYDIDHNGTLSLEELHIFLNDLLASTGNARRVTHKEAQNVMKAIDQNGDGRINKYEMFCCFKYLTGNGKHGQGPFSMTGHQRALQDHQLKAVAGQAYPVHHTPGGYRPIGGGVIPTNPMIGMAPMFPAAYGAQFANFGMAQLYTPM